MAPTNDHTDPNLSRTQAILRAAALAAVRSTGEASWPEIADEVLASLGEASGAERVRIFQQTTPGDGQEGLRLDRGWRRAGPNGTEEAEPMAVEDSGTSTRRIPIYAGRDEWGLLCFDDSPGSAEWTELDLEAIRTAAGVIAAAIHQDVLDEDRRQAEAWLNSHIENLPVVTYIEFTDDGHQLGYDEAYVSPQIEVMLGYSPEEWLHDDDLSIWDETIHPEDRERLNEEAARTARTGEPYNAEYRMRNKITGEWVWVSDRAHLVEGHGDVRPYWHGVMVDITERKHMEEQIAFLAYHDSLTGLANRQLFEEMLEPAIARARRDDLAVAVLFMDLDHFKEVNDTLGHDVGDELLKEVADRLREATRDTDLVARQGGDEFLVLIPDIAATGDADESAEPGKERAITIAEALAERIRMLMSRPFSVGEHEVRTSMSIGVSVFPLDAIDKRTLLKNADSAMYESKKTRAGGYAVAAETTVDPLRQLSLPRRLRRAVDERPWVLHYQPMVSIETGEMFGVEALLRWRKPKGDLVGPHEFLPLAEEMGLLEVIGEWVLDELCRQDKEWRGAGRELQLSINLSPTQLFQRDLGQRVTATLDDAGIDPQRMIIEIAETTSVTDPARTQRILWSLRERGLKVALDDFGTGYSAPGRLKHLPIDVLKIDQPLIRDLPGDVEVADFVAAVIEFAIELGIQPLGEGIETEEQRAFLAEHGCALGQGYLFGRPVPGSEI